MAISPTSYAATSSVTWTGQLPANSLGAALMGSDEEGRLKVNSLLVQAFLNYESRHPHAPRRMPPCAKRSSSSCSTSTPMRRRAVQTRQPDTKPSRKSSPASSSPSPEVPVVEVVQVEDLKKEKPWSSSSSLPLGRRERQITSRSMLKTEGSMVNRKGQGVDRSSSSAASSPSSTCWVTMNPHDDGLRAGWLPERGEQEGTSVQWPMTVGILPEVALDLPPPYQQFQRGGLQSLYRSDREWWSACIADTPYPSSLEHFRGGPLTASEEGDDFVEEALRQVKAWSPGTDLAYLPAPSYTSPFFSSYWP